MSSQRYGKPKTRTITPEYLAKLQKHYPPKRRDGHGNEIDWTEADIPWLIDYAENDIDREKNAKLERKRHEEEQRRMEAYEKQQRERSEQDRKRLRQLPERQLQRLLSAEYPRYDYGNGYSVRTYPAFVCKPPTIYQQQGATLKMESIEPGISLLRQEYRVGRIIRLDRETHKRLVDFAIPDETYQDLINRLLDTTTTTDK